MSDFVERLAVFTRLFGRHFFLLIIIILFFAAAFETDVSSEPSVLENAETCEE